MTKCRNGNEKEGNTARGEVQKVYPVCRLEIGPVLTLTSSATWELCAAVRDAICVDHGGPMHTLFLLLGGCVDWPFALVHTRGLD